MLLNCSDNSQLIVSLKIETSNLSDLIKNKSWNYLYEKYEEQNI